jgi:hypothetical protein
MQNPEVVRAIESLARELKSINKHLEVIAQDVRKRQHEKDNYLVKGMK